MPTAVSLRRRRARFARLFDSSLSCPAARLPLRERKPGAERGKAAGEATA